MNTDAILDFLVEYYVWFIIGGVILILAIIGFVADKKKLLPKNKKNNKNDDSKNEANYESESLKVEKDNNLDAAIVYGMSENLNFAEENKSQEDNSIEVLDDFSNDGYNNVNFENKSINTELHNIENFRNENIDTELYNSENVGNENINTEVYNNINLDNENISTELYQQEEFSPNNSYVYDNSEPLFDEVSSEENFVNNTIDNLNAEKIVEPMIGYDELSTPDFFKENQLPITDLKLDNENVENPISLENNNIDFNGQHDIKIDLEQINENINKYKLENQTLSLKKVDETINKINNMDFSINEKKDPLEDTMQISYSQLKEMVEDIIEENAKEKNINNINDLNVSNIKNIDEDIVSSNQDVTNVSLPKLDSSVIESIKNQDDEDDVWKF